VSSCYLELGKNSNKDRKSKIISHREGHVRNTRVAIPIDARKDVAGIFAALARQWAILHPTAAGRT